MRGVRLTVSASAPALPAALKGRRGGKPMAHGGPVQQGHSYLVGEYGPERFTPSASGHITPNRDLGGGGGGGNVFLDGHLVGRILDADLGRRFDLAGGGPDYRRAD